MNYYFLYLKFRLFELSIKSISKHVIIEINYNRVVQ